MDNNDQTIETGTDEIEETKPSLKAKTKKFWADHHEAIIAATVGVVITGVAAVLISQTTEDEEDDDDISIDLPAQTGSITAGRDNYAPVINYSQVLVRRGHPGNVIQCDETKEVFASQNRAAEVFVVSPSRMSSHLKGDLDNVDGHHFTKLGEM